MITLATGQRRSTDKNRRARYASYYYYLFILFFIPYLLLLFLILLLIILATCAISFMSPIRFKLLIITVLIIMLPQVNGWQLAATCFLPSNS